MFPQRKDDMSNSNPATDHIPESQTGKKDEKAPSLLIPMFKLPLVMYRLRLGWLLGKRFMQITHVGRRSGRTYRTVLAVLKFDKKTNEIYAVSAWKGSDWYYNIQSSPLCRWRRDSSTMCRCSAYFRQRKLQPHLWNIGSSIPSSAGWSAASPAGNGTRPMKNSCCWHVHYVV